ERLFYPIQFIAVILFKLTLNTYGVQFSCMNLCCYKHYTPPVFSYWIALPVKSRQGSNIRNKQASSF
ncbi:MAG: hypothetical protein P8048_05760, partial [Calditrichia bacterium]